MPSERRRAPRRLSVSTASFCLLHLQDHFPFHLGPALAEMSFPMFASADRNDIRHAVCFLVRQDKDIVSVVHQTTYEALRNVSPMLASRTGLSTAEDSMDDVATKLAELIGPPLARFPR